MDISDNPDDDAYDYLIYDGGQDYLKSDNDLKVYKNSDNTFNFTDIGHAERGVGEVITCKNESYVVVFWEKDTGNVTNGELMSLLSEFNKNNDVSAVTF